MDHISINRTCRLCLKNSNGTFKILDETVQYTLNSIQLYLNLTITDEPVICETCTENLHRCLEFKAKCMFNIDPIRSLVSGEIDSDDVDKNQIATKSNDYNICRFCLKGVKCGAFTCLQNDDTDRLWKHFPEVYLQVAEPSVVCMTCHESLQCHFDFLKCCIQTEEKITEYCNTEGTNSEGLVDLRCIANFVPKDISKDDIEAVKIGEMLVKNENHLDTDSEVIIKQELEPVEEIKIESIECDSPKVETLSSENESVSKETTYNCTICTFQSKYKKNLRKHVLLHNNKNEKTIHNCSLCDYHTKHRYDFLKHLLIHKNNGDVAKYTCPDCSYETKFKKCLDRHMITHKSSSEVTMYKCTECSFETKYKNSLPKHLVTHKSTKGTEGNIETPEERTRLDNLPMYKCTECSFETKNSYVIKRHLVVHKNSSEVMMHKCTLCGFATKHKYNLGIHMVTHQDSSEVTMYNCGECSFETKHKRSLCNHLLMHKSKKLGKLV